MSSDFPGAGPTGDVGKVVFEPAALDQDVLSGLREFFALLDVVEESDSGREFHPNRVWSCRVRDSLKLEAALKKMRRALV